MRHPGRSEEEILAIRQQQRRWLRGLLVICCVAVATGLFLPGEPERPLTIAINPWPGYEFATLARHKGFFREEGVDVRLIELSSLSDARRAFERGQADGFFGTVTEVLQSHKLSSRKAQVVLVTDYSDGADIILAKPEIKAVKNLKGKRIAIESGSLDSYILSRALEKAGLAWTDVTVIHLPSIEMGSALAAGKLDALISSLPEANQLIQSGKCHAIFSTRQLPQEVVDVMAMDASVLAKRKDQVAAFTRAFHRAQEYAYSHPDEAINIMAARQRVTPDEFKKALANGIKIVGRDEQAPFFGRDGKLMDIMPATANALKNSSQLTGTVDIAETIAGLSDQ